MYHKTLYGFGPRQLQQHRFQSPALAAVNISESDKGYELSMMAPGRNKEDFKIRLNEDILTISYEKKENTTQEKMILNEFHLNSFERSFRLNEKVDAGNISARYENGILHLSLPRKEQTPALARQIAVA